MPRLIWLMLNDGRSVVAGCGSNRSTVARALSQPDRTFVLTSDDSVDYLPAGDVKKFVIFEAVKKLPPSTSIYRLLHV